MPSPLSDSSISLGVLGQYLVDHTPSFGLYLRLNEQLVFVDLRQDKSLEMRKARALELFAQQEVLEANLAEFIRSNPGFGTRQLAYIGLHSKDIQQGEVFWDPEGYTLLKGSCFALE